MKPGYIHFIQDFAHKSHRIVPRSQLRLMKQIFSLYHRRNYPKSGAGAEATATRRQACTHPIARLRWRRPSNKKWMNKVTFPFGSAIAAATAYMTAYQVTGMKYAGTHWRSARAGGTVDHAIDSEGNPTIRRDRHGGVTVWAARRPIGKIVGGIALWSGWSQLSSEL